MSAKSNSLLPPVVGPKIHQAAVRCKQLTKISDENILKKMQDLISRKLNDIS
jgi:hypothetical protein